MSGCYILTSSNIGDIPTGSINTKRIFPQLIKLPSSFTNVYTDLIEEKVSGAFGNEDAYSYLLLFKFSFEMESLKDDSGQCIYDLSFPFSGFNSGNLFSASDVNVNIYGLKPYGTFPMVTSFRESKVNNLVGSMTNLYLTQGTEDMSRFNVDGSFRIITNRKIV